MIQAGQVLHGRYKLLKPLGQGSQAFVWVAEHLALGSQVAVKLIDPELAKQEDARERFAREASAAAKLRSAHVVQILDHGLEGDQPFIVMELLEGEDLFDRLDRKRRLSLAETSKVVTEVARALMRAHAEGIIHRDLKPENVFLSRNEDDELAKVLDFGVAKVVTPAKTAMVRTGVGTLIGTPHYMSPEQVKGIREIDHRSDLWSLGVIAYQCVTGQMPFDSEGVGDLLIRISLNHPTSPSKLNAELSSAFDEWFHKACAKDPEERFQTAREMADALARIVGSPLASRPGRVLVNLDEGELDWGSLAGVRIPLPARKPSPSKEPRDAGDDRAGSERGKSSEDIYPDEDSMVRVVDGNSRPPPAPEEPPPSSPGARKLRVVAKEAADDREEPPVSAGPTSSRRTPAPTARATESNPERDDHRAEERAPVSARGSANPFLDGAPSTGGRRGRNQPSTVTGLASTSEPSRIDVPAEFDGSRRRRATWLLALGVVVVAVVVTVGVIRSNGGFSGSETATAKPAQAQTGHEVATALGTVPPVLTGLATASNSAKPYDSSKKAIRSATTVRPVSTKPREDEVIIEIPNPTRPK